MLLPKPASLSAGLLARKGEASPAIRRQRVVAASPAAAPIAMRQPVDHDGHAVPGEAARHAIRLRLDEHRYLKLRLAAATSGRSAHEVVTAALDAFLATLPEGGGADRAATSIITHDRSGT